MNAALPLVDCFASLVVMKNGIRDVKDNIGSIVVRVLLFECEIWGHRR
jgi:hypothetical protein